MEAASKHQSIMEALKKLLPKSTEEVMNILKEKDPNGVLESSVLSLMSKTCDVLFVNNDYRYTIDHKNCDDFPSNIQPDTHIDNSNRPNGGDGEISQTSESPFYENKCSKDQGNFKKSEVSKLSITCENLDVNNICANTTELRESTRCHVSTLITKEHCNHSNIQVSKPSKTSNNQDIHNMCTKNDRHSNQFEASKQSKTSDVQNICSNTEEHSNHSQASKPSETCKNQDVQNICTSTDRHSNNSEFTKQSKTDFSKCRENCEILIDYIWEKLNTGYWKDVPVAWRYAYTIVSMLKMFVEIHLLIDGDSKVKFSEVMKTCDMGLLMGAPLLDSVLAKMSACISPLNPDCNNVLPKASTFNIDTSPKMKRQKLSNVTDLITHDPLCSLDETKSIKRVSCPSLESFQNNFLNARVPVIITDAIDFWPAMSNRKWTLDYIKSIAGTRTVPIEIGSKYTEDSWSQTLMTIRDFIDQHIKHPCENNSTPKGYLAQHQLFDQIPELQNDISIPTYCCLGNNDDVDVNAWFGPKGTVSPLHYDDKDNLLTQVMGSKYIRLYSDGATPCIYPHPHRLLHNTSQVDVEQPNYHQFPKFQTAPYTECMLNPGEMLFIPSKFWHFVKSLSVSFSVSFWWQ